MWMKRERRKINWAVRRRRCIAGDVTMYKCSPWMVSCLASVACCSVAMIVLLYCSELMFLG
jgi:hypothetical protein